MTIRERAADAHAKQQAEEQAVNEAKEEKQFAAEIEYLLENWGFDFIQFAEENLYIEVDWDNSFPAPEIRGIIIAGSCQNCGAEVFSKTVMTWEELGKQIEDFEAGYKHRLNDCRVTTEPTWQDKLADAIAEALDEIGGYD